MKTVLATLLMILCLGSAITYAHEGSEMDKSDKMQKMWMEMTPEKRQTMATGHEKLAVCLRSTRPMTECHDEMQKSCDDTMGKEACSMMDMKHHKDMHRKSGKK